VLLSLAGAAQTLDMVVANTRETMHTMYRATRAILVNVQQTCRYDCAELHRPQVQHYIARNLRKVPLPATCPDPCSERRVWACCSSQGKLCSANNMRKSTTSTCFRHFGRLRSLYIFPALISMDRAAVIAGQYLSVHCAITVHLFSCFYSLFLGGARCLVPISTLSNLSRDLRAD
jgi:hypothetical protein